MRNLVTFRNFNSNPFYIFDEVEKDLHKAFGFSAPKIASGNGEVRGRGTNLYPLCDLADRDTHYVLSFDLPGVGKEDLKLEVKEGQLHISGERKRSFKEGDYSEKSYGYFERIVTLPKGIEEDKIEAHYDHGVLSLAIPKVEKVQAKKIAIEDNKRMVYGLDC